MHIAILSSSVRTGRNSHRVALYFKNYIETHKLATAEILDLNEYNFPLFEERLKFLKTPSSQVQDFAGKISMAHGVLIVTPEYNGGYPASLKNVIDLLYDVWHRKPIAIASVSDGAFGGSQVYTSLLFSLFKIRAWVVPAMYLIPKVHDAYDEAGTALDKETTDKRAAVFLNELLWCMTARELMLN